MLNQEDIRNIIEAQKEIFPTKEDFDRHEKWLHEVAEKLGIKLKY